MVKKIQAYQQKEEVNLSKEIKLLGKVSTLGKERYIVLIGKKDNAIIKDFAGHVVVMNMRRALDD